MTDSPYKTKMVQEFSKFLRVYNDLAGTQWSVDLNGHYDYFIRVLGNYISCVYTETDWHRSVMVFSDQIQFRFEVFQGTTYESKVAAYLKQLRVAFEETLDQEVQTYLTETADYNEEEKTICRLFFEKVTQLHKAMKSNAFQGTLDSNLTDPESISHYKETLKDYNDFMFYVARNRAVNSLIQHFDQKIRTLAANKQPTDVLFDV